MTSMTTRRRWVVAGACATIAAAAASVSLDAGRTWLVLDATDRPLQGVYVAYHYEGPEFHVVESGTYERRGVLLRSGPGGSVRFPPRLQVHWPFPLQGVPQLRLDLVYAPQLHAAVAPALAPDLVRPGVSHVVNRAARTIRLVDCTTSPEQWSQTLEALRLFLLTPLFGREGDQTVVIDAAAKRQLVGAFRAELSAFLERYSKAERDIPSPTAAREWPFLSAGEQASRIAQSEAERQVRRTWGEHAAFWFGPALASYEQQLGRAAQDQR